MDPRFYRPAEVNLLLSNPQKANAELDWYPDHTFEELVHMMVDADLEQLRSDGSESAVARIAA